MEEKIHLEERITIQNQNQEMKDWNEELYQVWEERQQERDLLTLKGRKEEEGSLVPMTMSTITLRKGKETKEQRTQTGDLRNETWKVRPGEANLPIPTNKRVRYRNWKKIEESSR